MERGEGREEEERGGGGGVGWNETHRWEGAGRRSRDPCDVVGILMSHKVTRQKIRRNKVHRGSAVGKQAHRRNGFQETVESREV